MVEIKNFTPAGKIIFECANSVKRNQSCFGESFSSLCSLRSSSSKKKKKCRYCTDTKTTFTSSVMLKNHISLMHGIKNPDLSQMPKMSNQESKTTPRKVCQVLFNVIGTDWNTASPTCHISCVFIHLQELVSDRAAPDAQKREEDRVLNLGAPSTKRPKAQFRCSKCGFVTDDGVQFQQHIPQHKTDDDTPQCLHCGLCFTSALSLNRHLFIVHKVKEEEKEEEGGELEKMEQDNQPARAADSDEVKKPSPDLNEPAIPQTKEPTSPQREEVADGDLQQSPRSHTEAPPLR